MPNIVISGATGFLGSHLTHRLVNDGHRVVALVRNQSSRRRLSGVAAHVHFCNVETLDLATALQQLKPIDVVIHTMTEYGRRGETLSTLVETNVVWGLRLAEAALRAEAFCFLNIGSALAPEVSPYALSKSQFSQWGRWLAEQHMVQFVDVALEHMYGEDDDITKFVTSVIVNCLRNVARLPLTAGEQKRDFIYIEDVVSALSKLVSAYTDPAALAPSGGYFHYPLGSGVAVTVRELVERLHAAVGGDTYLDFAALPYRRHEIMVAEADLTALNALGWTPRYSLQEGIERTVAWYKSHWKDIESCVG